MSGNPLINVGQSTQTPTSALKHACISQAYTRNNFGVLELAWGNLPQARPHRRRESDAHSDASLREARLTLKVVDVSGLDLDLNRGVTPHASSSSSSSSSSSRKNSVVRQLTLPLRALFAVNSSSISSNHKGPADPFLGLFTRPFFSLFTDIPLLTSISGSSNSSAFLSLSTADVRDPARTGEDAGSHE